MIRLSELRLPLAALPKLHCPLELSALDLRRYGADISFMGAGYPNRREAFRTAAQAIGYKEFFPYFEQTAALDACTEKLKQASRNYAKRQLTWFRHMDGVTWLDAGAADVRQTALRLTQDFLLKG